MSNRYASLIWTIAFVVVVLAIGTPSWYYLHRETQSAYEAEPKPVKQGDIESAALIEVPVLTDVTDVTTEQQVHLTINIHYPKVELAQHTQFAKEANDVIRAFITQAKDDFRKNVSEMYSASVPAEFTSDLTMRYTPLLLSPTIISLRFDSSEYIAGAAHPNNQIRILNYDFSKHLLLSPTDLFASSTQALPFLSEYSRTALRKKFTDISEQEFKDQVIPGTEPKYENFDGVGITKEGLVIVFNPYQVAAYARGAPEIRVSMPDLEGIISKDLREAIRMSKENIVEAEPLNEPN